ncbi:MAG: NAD(P)-dependent oxidoreductase [Flavobacteriaceae bacterium]|nr:NAD(P)-dependent oxidoreductase [Flavobacteriaceae bacterium]
MKFAIIKERKNPPDRRVVFSPEACKALLKNHKEMEIEIESSTIRTFSDNEYRDLGLQVSDDISDCDVLIGVKEVPIDALILNKKYFFFSHTIKKQAYNRNLLKAILDKNIELYDHEVITNSKGKRVVAFGVYAGIVGAYNTFRAYGLKNKTFNLPKAENLKNKRELIEELKKITLPNIKIVITGKGRVSSGAKEMLDAMNIKEVSVNDYLNNHFYETVYTQLNAIAYNKRKDDKVLGVNDFFKNPSAYKSNFMRFTKVSDIYIACHFYGDGSPYLFTRNDAKHPKFKIKVVGDISCDINGPVASTIRSSTIENPIYGYDPISEKEVDYLNPEAIAVMAVDNLPCELPKDASIGFGNSFAEFVIPAFFNGDKDGVLERALMTKGGKLTEKFSYLQDYVDGKE